MATTNCLEANHSAKQIPVLQGEEDEDVNSSAILENHNSELLNEPTKSKTDHQFYFVKLWPFKDPDEASKISEAEKLLQQSEQEFICVNDKCKMLRPAWRFGWLQLQKLENCSKNTSSKMGWAKRVLVHLQTALDNLNFTDAHQKVANKSTFSTKQNTYWPGFNRKMLHGSTNLAIERQRLREIDRSQERLNYFMAEEYRSKERLNYFMAGRPGVLLHESDLKESRWNNTGNYIDRAKYIKMLEKIRKIEERKKKALGDAIAKGQPFDPLSTKRAIQEQIKVVKQILLELEREHREVILEIERAKKKLDAFRKDVGLVIEQRREICRKRFEAQQHLFLRQQAENMNGRYEENVSMCMNYARELARKKDVASLRRLSRWQVKKFMSDWNNCRYLRISYETSILRSLESRGLSRPGWTDQEQ